jgi:hypothetical protein
MSLPPSLILDVSPHAAQRTPTFFTDSIHWPSVLSLLDAPCPYSAHSIPNPFLVIALPLPIPCARTLSVPPAHHASPPAASIRPISIPAASHPLYPRRNPLLQQCRSSRFLMIVLQPAVVPGIHCCASRDHPSGRRPIFFAVLSRAFFSSLLIVAVSRLGFLHVVFIPLHYLLNFRLILVWFGLMPSLCVCDGRGSFRSTVTYCMQRLTARSSVDVWA